MTYANTEVKVVSERAAGSIVLAHSVTWLAAEAAGAVVVTGSHSGLFSGLVAAARDAKAFIGNDAGVGKQRAGVLGLLRLARYGVAAAAASHMSARIGDASDTWATGVIAHANVWANAAGVRPGMPVRTAADLLAAWTRASMTVPAPPSERVRRLTVSGVTVWLLDSASAINSDMESDIVVTGSHGGLVGSNVIKGDVRAAFFNDAGVGKQGAGIGRVLALQDLGIAAVAVSHMSARIGDGSDSYANGSVSAVNPNAEQAGVRVGQTVRAAVRALAG